MLSKNRRLRGIPATAPTPHRRSEQAPQPPHAATEPTLTPTDAFAGVHRYDPGTIPGLRAHAANCVQKAEAAEQEANGVIAEANEEANRLLAEANAKVNGLLSRAAHLRVSAADHLRVAGLAELDAVTPPDAAWPVQAPQVAPPDAVYHFSDGVSFWPPCGEREGATWQTVNPGDVTCPACLAALEDRRQQSPGPEPRADWSVLPSQDGDTERLPRVTAEVAR